MPAERGKHSTQPTVAGDALRFAPRAPEPHCLAANDECKNSIQLSFVRKEIS